MTYDNWLASHYEPGGGYGGQSGSVRGREREPIEEYDNMNQPDQITKLSVKIANRLIDEGIFPEFIEAEIRAWLWHLDVGTDDIRPTDGAVEET